MNGKYKAVQGNLQHKSRSNTQHWLVSFGHHRYKTQLSSSQEHKTVELEEHKFTNIPMQCNYNTCMLAYKDCLSKQLNEASLPSASCWVCNRSDKTWPGWAGRSPHRSCSNIKKIKEVTDKGLVRSIETICITNRLLYREKTLNIESVDKICKKCMCVWSLKRSWRSDLKL